MTLLTIYALFGDDLRMCAFEKKDDDIFFGLAVVCLFFFSLELIASFIVKKDYR